MIDWDTLRVVLFVHRHGGLNGAASALGVSQPTVSRHLARAETNLDCKLFDRRRGHLVATQAGMIVIADAEAVEQKLRLMSESIRSLDREMSGTIHVSAPHHLLPYCVAEEIRDFQALHPDLNITLTVSDTLADMDAGSADIVFRAEENPRPSLWGRRIGRLDFGYFASQDLAARIAPEGQPLTSVADLPLIAHDGVVRAAANELTALFPNGRIVARCNHVEASTALVCQGMGVGRLPYLVANALPDLVAVQSSAVSRSLWVLTHQDLRNVTRLSRFIDFVSERMASKAEQLQSP